MYSRQMKLDYYDRSDENWWRRVFNDLKQDKFREAVRLRDKQARESNALLIQSELENVVKSERWNTSRMSEEDQFSWGLHRSIVRSIARSIDNPCIGSMYRIHTHTCSKNIVATTSVVSP